MLGTCNGDCSTSFALGHIILQHITETDVFGRVGVLGIVCIEVDEESLRQDPFSLVPVVHFKPETYHCF